MIQFNLLPDVKQAFIKARRTKRMVLLIAIGATTFSISIAVLLFTVVKVFQPAHLKNLNDDIKKYSNELESTPDLSKVLTVQNQLKSLPDLHNNKIVADRLFTYVGQLTPNEVYISKFIIDFNANTISISGAANDLTLVNKFADTLKFTDYKTNDNTSNKAFSNVVLANFVRDDKSTQYQIILTFDPVIFNSANSIKLIVPNIISTRSETEKPSNLFQNLDTQTNPRSQ